MDGHRVRGTGGEGVLVKWWGGGVMTRTMHVRADGWVTITTSIGYHRHL
jgi:hypothetical protein